MSIIAWMVVGAIAGWIAGSVVPGDEGYGVLGGLIAGIVGAIVGGYLFGLLTSNEDWLTGIDIPTLIAAIVGAIIVVFLWNMITRRRSTPPSDRRIRPIDPPGAAAPGVCRVGAAATIGAVPDEPAPDAAQRHRRRRRSPSRSTGPRR